MSRRISSHADFWEERYHEHPGMFGQRPNALVEQEAERILYGGEVLDVGAGEGRNAVFLARERSADVVAADFSSKALSATRELAQVNNVRVKMRKLDVRRWDPSRRWDAIVVTFVQILEAEHPRFYRSLRQALLPGGVLVAEWFRPAHLGNGYARIGPSAEDRMVEAAELLKVFPQAGIIRCDENDVWLDEGPMLQGRAAVIRFVYREPDGGGSGPAPGKM